MPHCQKGIWFAYPWIWHQGKVKKIKTNKKAITKSKHTSNMADYSPLIKRNSHIRVKNQMITLPFYKTSNFKVRVQNTSETYK